MRCRRLLPPPQVEIIAKAVDGNGNTQPERVSSIWNIRGLANNAASRVTVTAASEQK